ncbi:NADPH-dependent FMN reductase [Streptomyces sp. TP-A0874]|uniref:NADPH-dependent FMN reductase n=1 Tax=Streptomyces sp. TP-A0874 TaxID=549819 RepID=UPI00085369FE|nr:NAD(P)H-dependent oxidoreductase [Streptomyces sp. TP-A0874]
MSTAPDPLRVSVIIGSSREGRFGPTVATWFIDHARQRENLALDVIDLVEAPLALAPGAASPGSRREAEELSERLRTADAFVVVTPEYNHSFPASLKSVIDAHSTEWRAKPVGFVSYGGLGGGLRAVEQLRLVFAELHAVTVRDSVSFHTAWERFDGEGSLIEATMYEGSAKGMLDQLTWWATALREAKAVRPYEV